MHFVGISKFRNILQLVAIVTFVFSSTSAFAVTPADVFQKVDYLGKIVERFLESDLHEASLEEDPELVPSRPRHVLRLATYAYENIQFLRSLNGLPQTQSINTQPEEVTPKDVLNVVNSSIRAAKEMADVYNVDLNFAEPAKPEKKSPSDVLARLRSINNALQKLGTPIPLPNDVFRMSLSITEQTKTLTELTNTEIKGKVLKASKATPIQALNEAVRLFSDLEKLALKDNRFELPGGIAKPPLPPKGVKVTPKNVLIATQYALADIYALNVKLGHKEELKLPEEQAGQNPTNVTNTLSEARLHLKSVTQK